MGGIATGTALTPVQAGQQGTFVLADNASTTASPNSAAPPTGGTPNLTAQNGQTPPGGKIDPASLVIGFVMGSHMNSASPTGSAGPIGAGIGATARV